MLGFLWKLFEARVAEKIEAAAVEFSLVALAILLLAAAIAVAVYVPKLLPFRGKIIAALLIGAATAGAVDYGYRWRGRLDASASYLREIEEKNAELVEREREAKASSEIAARERARADQTETELNDTNGKVADYVAELEKAKDACAIGGSDFRRLQQFRRHDPGRVPPVPPRRPAFFRPAGSISIVPGRQ